jgi:hypothetical protein
MRLNGLLLGTLLLATVPLAQAQFGYGYDFGRNKIHYDNFDWHVLRTDHFDIYFYPEMQELAEHGAFFAEEAYAELENRFNFSLNHRVPIIFYSSNLHFKQTNITPGFIPDGVGGFFEFLKGRVVIPANGNLHRFRRVIRHELVHVFTYNRLLRVMRDHRKPPDRFLPLWFTEGLAEYWSGGQDHQHEMVMRDALYSNYLVPLENIYRIQGSYLMYKQGEALCRFISERYGEEKILELFDNFWKDKDFTKVMEITLRDDIRVIDAQWQAWMKQQYFPHLEEADLLSLLTDGIVAKGFTSKPVFYQYQDGRRSVFYTGNLNGYSNIFEVPIDSLYQPLGPPRVLVHGERDAQFEAFHLFESRLNVSKGGKLAFVTKSGERDVIHVYDLESRVLEATYAFEDLVAIYSPDWSPDGTKLVFSSIDQGGFADLYVYHREAGTLERLTQDSYDDQDPAWSPDGTQIAFSSDRTAAGQQGAYNLFTWQLADGQVSYVTYGQRLDLSPRWSPDGRSLVFISTQPDSTGRFGAQNVWVADMGALGPTPAMASTHPTDDPGLPPATSRALRRLTTFTTAAFDPVWTPDNRLVFTGFEGYRFTVRSLPAVDSLLAAPKEEQQVDLAQAGPSWAFARIGVDSGAERLPYRRRYRLDIAQGGVSQTAVLGTTGGAVLAFSDMLGDDYFYLTVFNSATSQGDFLRSLSFAATRVQLQRRTGVAYGLYRFSGRRYDLTDPDTPRGLPILYETLYGGFGSVNYPLSMFRRAELSTSLSWSSKEIPTGNALGQFERDALLLSNAVALVHDNALYGYNGPIDGSRANLTLGYTTDVLYSNVSYFSVIADARHYTRLGPFTLASWAMARLNEGREARLHILGGSWDLRGFRLFSVRGQKLWFTSHELRFPLLNAPSAFVPLLAPFGIANLRGALFFDAAHVWNDDYRDRSEVFQGETLGATGIGFRMNLFGGLVLRYDLGYRYREGFTTRERLFRQFFFGWDF